MGKNFKTHGSKSNSGRGRSLAWENARLGPANLHPFSFIPWSYEVNSDGHINHGVIGHINLLNIKVPLTEETS